MVVVLVTGSRTWTDPIPVRKALDELLVEFGELTVRHGGCLTGPDNFAEEWAVEHHQSSYVHSARWDIYGRSAGIIRNREMVKAGADICLAFIRNWSRGATHCMNEALTAGIEVLLFAWDKERSEVEQ